MKFKFKPFLNLLVWISIALLIRWQIVEPRWIPSGSMLPTLLIQERLLIEKVTPRLDRALNKYPKRNSIVVFKPPEILISSGFNKNSALIKRVIGIPGDKIEVRNGYLFLNDQKIIEPWVKYPISYEMNQIVIPKGYIWVLGDNRNNSYDSHSWGYLPYENVIGKAFIGYWPIKKMGPIRFSST